MLNPVVNNIFFSKNDPQDTRIGDLSKSRSLHESFTENHCLIGYPDDQGIKLNGGRVGAALGPDKIREFLYKMTPALHTDKNTPIADLGNIDIKLPLSDRHQIGRQICFQLYTKHKKVISLGGGHDYAYSDISGFLDYYKDQKPDLKPLVINFDAHLDVRDPDNLKKTNSEPSLNSGTAFFRLLTEFPSEFDFVEFGIQDQCNSRHHLHWAKNAGAKVVSIEQIEKEGYWQPIAEDCTVAQRRPCFLSIDIDAFTSSEAPGCSQSWATGLKISEFFKLFHQLANHLSIQGIGIYVVSPPLDNDNQTSKLAALIAHRFLHL